MALLGAFLAISFPFVYVRPQRGLLLLAALVPFHGLLPVLPAGLVPSYWKEVLLVMVVLAAVVSPNRLSRRTPSLPWMPFMGILVAGAALSAVIVHGSVGLLPLKVSFFYAVLIPPIVMYHPFTSRDRDSLVTIMMVVAFVSSVYGIAQQFIGADTLHTWGYQWNETIRTAGPLLRSFSIFVLPFSFGLYVMLALLVGGAVALSDPGRLRNRLFLWSTPILLAGMAVSVVRASYLGFVVGICFLALVAFPRIRRGIALAAALSVVTLLVLPTAITSNLLSSNSLGERSAGWTQMIRDLTRYPFGQGLGLTGASADKLALQIGAAKIPYQPDNYYLRLGLELGPIAVALFLAILVVAYKAMMRTWVSAPVRGDRYFAVGVAAFILASAAASLVATYLDMFPIDVYFWLLLSVGATTLRHRTTSRARSVEKPAT